MAGDDRIRISHLRSCSVVLDALLFSILARNRTRDRARARADDACRPPIDSPATLIGNCDIAGIRSRDVGQSEGITVIGHLELSERKGHFRAGAEHSAECSTRRCARFRSLGSDSNGIDFPLLFKWYLNHFSALFNARALNTRRRVYDSARFGIC